MPTRPVPLVLRSLATLAACAAILLPVRASLAQLGLPDSVPTSQQLTEAQQEEISRLVGSTKAGLAGEPAAVRRARAALQQPLRVRGVSVDFRTRYTDALVPVLKPLVVSEKDAVAINALRLAGDLGTKQGLDLLVPALADKRASVRAAAALACAAAFHAARVEQPALSPSQVTPVLETLRRAIVSEKDPAVQDAVSVALAAAADIPNGHLEGVRARAAGTLALAVGELAQGAGPQAPAYGPIIRAGRTLFDLLSKNDVDIGKEAMVEAGGYAGDVIALARRRLSSGTIDDAERAQLALAVGQATRVIYFAQQRLGAPPVEAKLDTLIASSADAQFRTDAARLIDTGGAVTVAPFNFAADRFASRTP